LEHTASDVLDISALGFDLLGKGGNPDNRIFCTQPENPTSTFPYDDDFCLVSG